MTEKLLLTDTANQVAVQRLLEPVGVKVTGKPLKEAEDELKTELDDLRRVMRAPTLQKLFARLR